MAADNPHHDKRWLILATVCVAQLMIVADVTIVNVALPSAQAELGFSDGLRQWIVTTYALAFGSLLLLGGRLADRFGRRRALIVGFVGFAVASAAGGAAESFGMLVSARAVQGAFAALLAPAALSVLVTTFEDPGERGKALGAFGAVAGAGAAVGLVLGGVLTEALSWRWVLYVNIAFALPAALATLRLLIRQAQARRPSLDLPGAATSTGGLFCLIYGLSAAGSGSWDNPVTIVTLVLACLLMVAFVWIESRAHSPLLPLGLVRDRMRGGSLLAIAVTFGPVVAVLFFVSFYLQQVQGLSPIETGLAFLPQSLTVVPTTILVNAKLVPRVGVRPLLVAGLALIAAGTLWLTQLEPSSSYAGAVLPALFVIGLGLGNIVGSSLVGATSGVRSADSGVASAAVDVATQVGAAVGVAALSTIAGADTGADASLEGTTDAFLVATAALTVGAVAVGALMQAVTPEPRADA